MKRISLTMEEALDWLKVLHSVLQRDNYRFDAEHVMEMIYRLPRPGFVRSERQKYANYLLPGGRRGHIRLTLYPPYNSRYLAFFAAIIRAIEDGTT